MAPFPIGTFVGTFLDREKDDARRLIRHEIESMLDPLVESLFGQLKAKFVDYVKTAPDFHQELAHDREDDGQMILQNLPTIVDAQQYHSQSLTNAGSIDANSQINSTNNIVPLALMSIKQEINDPSNVQLEPQQNDHSINSSSKHGPSLLPQPINPSADESLNSEMQQQQQSHINDNEYDDDDDDEEECDCDECVYGIIDLKEEVDDDVQLIDDHQSGPPVKKPRMDPTQSQLIGSQGPIERTNQDQQSQVNNHDKPIIITLGLQCTESNCFETFAPNDDHSVVDQLKVHMWDVHSIGPFRCHVKDCTESFHHGNNLSSHINQAHANTSQWLCSKCAKHFSTYHQLFVHSTQNHQFGHFQCSFPECEFTGECRGNVYSHYKTQHKPDLLCQHPTCDYRTKNATRLKAHVRAHLGIEPYRCKWPVCGYSSASRDNTIAHIRRTHLMSSMTAGSSLNLRHLAQPKDFLEVVL